MAFYIIFGKNTYNMPEELVETDNRDLIVDALKADDRDLMWLHKKTGIPYGTIYSCLTQRLFKVSDENLIKINTALGTDFN